MLDPWIIEEIRRREEEDRQRRDERPVLEIPMELPVVVPTGKPPEDEERGVVIVDFSV